MPQKKEVDVSRPSKLFPLLLSLKKAQKVWFSPKISHLYMYSIYLYQTFENTLLLFFFFFFFFSESFYSSSTLTVPFSSSSLLLLSPNPTFPQKLHLLTLPPKTRVLSLSSLFSLLSSLVQTPQRLREPGEKKHISTAESETKRYLKDKGNGGEVGGSFVIVNEDSGDHSDRDLDAEGKKLDPKSKLENDETRAKEEEDLVNDDEKLIEENKSGSDIKVEEGKEIENEEKLGFDAQLVREEVEGDNVKELDIGKEKEETLVSGPGSDVKIVHEEFSVNNEDDLNLLWSII